MKRILLRRGLDCPTNVALVCEDVFGLEPGAAQRIMMIRSWRIRRYVAERRRFPNDCFSAEFVVSEHPFPFGMPAKKQNQIVQDWANATIFVELKIVVQSEAD
jgi:hypothetical protein